MIIVIHSNTASLSTINFGVLMKFGALMPISIKKMLLLQYGTIKARATPLFQLEHSESRYVDVIFCAS